MTADAPPTPGPAALEPGGTSPALREYLGVLARRKFLVILVLLIVPTVAVGLSVSQQPLYQGSAEVLLGQLDLASGLTGIDTTAAKPERVATTQAGLARVPAVVERTLLAAGVDRTAEDFLRASSVTTKTESDLLTFTVTDSDPKLASLLASTYARQYTAYRLELDTASIQKALADLEKRIRALGARKGGAGSLYENLVTNAEKLRTMKALLASNASVVRADETSAKIRPKPKRTAIFAIGLALVLGIGLAFLMEAVDTRVRLVEEIGQRLSLPLLARLPRSKRRRWSASSAAQAVQASNFASPLVMLENPTGVEAEGYRVLRANLDSVNADRRAQCIMLTSALENEGKSETVANLAVAFARSGRRVALVDLDLRRPTLHRLFGLSGGHGVADVMAGVVELDDALVRVPLARSVDELSVAGNNGNPSFDMLEVLPAGSALPAAGEFAATQGLGEILRSLCDRTDLVLVDTPALLRVGDAMALSAHVDALLVVVRFNAMRRPILKELRRVLDSCSAPRLGYVLTDAENDHGYGYGYGYGLEDRERTKDRERMGVSELVPIAAGTRKVPEWT